MGESGKMKSDLYPQNEKERGSVKASWVLYRYQLNILPDIHGSAGFHTVFSGPVLWEPFLFVYSALSLKDIQLKEIIYISTTVLLSQHPSTADKKKGKEI